MTEQEAIELLQDIQDQGIECHLTHDESKNKFLYFNEDTGRPIAVIHLSNISVLRKFFEQMNQVFEKRKERP
jgi:hypothetical protein